MFKTRLNAEVRHYRDLMLGSILWGCLLVMAACGGGGGNSAAAVVNQEDNTERIGEAPRYFAYDESHTLVGSFRYEKPASGDTANCRYTEIYTFKADQTYNFQYTYFCRGNNSVMMQTETGSYTETASMVYLKPNASSLGHSNLQKSGAHTLWDVWGQGNKTYFRTDPQAAVLFTDPAALSLRPSQSYSLTALVELMSGGYREVTDDCVFSTTGGGSFSSEVFTAAAAGDWTIVVDYWGLKATVPVTIVDISAQQPGVWQGDNVSFTVTDDGRYIDDFLLVFTYDIDNDYCDRTTRRELRNYDPVEIIDGSFYFLFEELTVRAEFVRDGILEGTYRYEHWNYECQHNILVEGTFSAQPQE